MNLSNGSNVTVSLVGKYFLTKDIVLENVFYVPSFRFNLLSVSRITQSGKIGITFFLIKKCSIQDLHNGATLGTGELVDGLYYFTGSSGHAYSAFIGSFVNSSVWHKRLGHPSNTVLSTLKSALNLSDFDLSDSCDVCHKVKQSRKLFPLSSHRSTALFDLVHADV